MHGAVECHRVHTAVPEARRGRVLSDERHGRDPVCRMGSLKKKPEEADAKATPRPAILLCVPCGFARDIPFKRVPSGREALSFAERSPAGL